MYIGDMKIVKQNYRIPSIKTHTDLAISCTFIKVSHMSLDFVC